VTTAQVRTRAELFREGYTRRSLANALGAGAIVRIRRDRYMEPGAATEVQTAVRIGGRLTCLSLLQLLGVFVLANSGVHVHIQRGASRLRSADPRRPRLEPRGTRLHRLHWSPLRVPDGATSTRVHVLDALLHAIVCQPARHAIASIDSALNKGLITTVDLSRLSAALPARRRMLVSLADGRAQSGPETLVRLMARSLGCHVELQRWFDGVGYVDLVLDGWLAVECDSKEFHSDWAQQLKDYRRDLALAARGFCVLRLTAEDILYRPESAMAALRGLVDAGRAAASV